MYGTFFQAKLCASSWAYYENEISEMTNPQAIAKKNWGKLNDGRFGCLEHTAGILGLFWGGSEKAFQEN